MELADYIEWLKRAEKQLADALETPDGAVEYYYELALEMCLPLRPYCPLPRVFAEIVYNLATHFLVVGSEDMDEPYSLLYDKYKVGEYGGFISSASNESTSASYDVPSGISDGDIDDFEYQATKYGRRYLALIYQVRPLAVN